MPGLSRTLALTLALLALPSPGCASGDGRDALVAWRLIDGRSCMDTSVAQVTIDFEGGNTATGICHAKANDNQLMLKGVRAGVTLHARGQSASMAVVYRAELRLVDPLPAVIDLPLYYTGGE